MIHDRRDDNTLTLFECDFGSIGDLQRFEAGHFEIYPLTRRNLHQKVGSDVYRDGAATHQEFESACRLIGGTLVFCNPKRRLSVRDVWRQFGSKDPRHWTVTAFKAVFMTLGIDPVPSKVMLSPG
jgi:hypothetical protein